MIDFATLFERKMTYPHPTARERLDRLVGLDEYKAKLTKILALLVNPRGLKRWGERYHPGADLLVDSVLHRPPLVILGGDVGSGKTEIAETIGDAVARQERIEVVLLPLSLSARGKGKVGEMTQLISGAFDYTVKEASAMKSKANNEGAVILLVDEADALAQSRELAQMHHEDRAGVNELIRGIDDLARSDLPVLVLMCTNRLSALDPAIRRRAAETFRFSRPTAEQRTEVLGRLFAGTPLAGPSLAAVAAATGETPQRPYGWTYSDLTDRLVTAAVLSAFPDQPLTVEGVLALAKEMEPTPPFASEPE